VLLAGLYEFWRNPTDPNPEPIATCTVITTTPGPDMEEIHDRMPVILQRDDVDTWLEVDDHSPEERLLLLRPAPRGTLRHYGVGKAVGSVRNNGPELIEPVEPVGPQSLF
jgi:putative SOS response-associated peptidase YedK